jgi:flagellar hook assembly protein FlgD
LRKVLLFNTFRKKSISISGVISICGLQVYYEPTLKFPEPGYVANITIMDAAGRPVRVLQRNATCAATGSFRWDGLNDKQQKVAVGVYIVFTEIFNLKGQKRMIKNTVTVAGKF